MTTARPMPPAAPFCLPDPECQQDEKNGQFHAPRHQRQRPPRHPALGQSQNHRRRHPPLPGRRPTLNPAGSPYPDLLVAFDTDPEAYDRSNGYIIAEQGKPPDFVLEIASASTGIFDVTTRRAAYAAMGVMEYWRFDATGEHHGTRLAGDRLVDGRYVPIPIDPLPDDILQGHSQSLNLLLRWKQGRLGWHNPATGYHIETFSSVRTRNRLDEAQADWARSDGILAEAQAIVDWARADRDRAETRIRELEEQLRNQLNP